MFWLPLVLATSHGSGPLVAFTARIYNPPGSTKPKSRCQLYLCDFDGRHRRQLTFGREDVIDLGWDSKTMLRFATASHPTRWIGCDIRTGETSPLPTPRKLDSEFHAWKSPKALVEEIDFDTANKPVLVRSPQRSGQLVLGEKDRYFEHDGQRVSVALPEFIYTVYRVKASGDVWLLALTPEKGDRYIRGAMNLYRVDWKRSRVHLVMENADSPDWNPTRPTWAMCTLRDLAPYGDGREIWTSELWVGNWKLGARKKIMGGKVEYIDLALQP